MATTKQSLVRILKEKREIEEGTIGTDKMNDLLFSFLCLGDDYDWVFQFSGQHGVSVTKCENCRTVLVCGTAGKYRP